MNQALTSDSTRAERSAGPLRPQPTAMAVATDFTSSIGCFFMLTRDGKLDAIDRISLAPGCSHVEIERANLNLSILSPLVSRVHRSNLSIAVHCGEVPRVQYKMRVTLGEKPRMMNALGTKMEIITRALDDDALPIIVEAELDRQLAAVLAEGVADDFPQVVNIPLRSIDVRKHLPGTIAQLLRELALENAEAITPKAGELKPTLRRLRASLRGVVLCDYMMKCIWLNPLSGQLGNVSGTPEGVEFTPFDVDEGKVSAFLCALERDRSNPSGSSLQMRAGSPPAALGRGFGVWVVRERARGAGG